MKTINKEQYYQLIGLLTLAKEYNKRLEDITKIVTKITKEKSDFGGHSGDAVYCNYTADELLYKLDIKVK